MQTIDAINKNDVLTVGVFERLSGKLLDEKLDKKLDEKLAGPFASIDARFEAIDARFERLETKMTEGFETVFDGLERLERRIDDLSMRKADREEMFLIHSRVTNLEKRI